MQSAAAEFTGSAEKHLQDPTHACQFVNLGSQLLILQKR